MQDIENNIKYFVHSFHMYMNELEYRDRCGIMNIPENVLIYCYHENNEPPHFHIIFDNNFEYGNCCLRIDINKQYLHGKHKRELKNKQLKQINRELSKDNYKVWKEIIKIWNKNNPNNKVKIDLEFKDYE